MKKIVSKLVCSRSEPHLMVCPKCGKVMTWNLAQGPGTGGWKCSNCELKIDYK